MKSDSHRSRGVLHARLLLGTLGVTSLLFAAGCRTARPVEGGFGLKASVAKAYEALKKEPIPTPAINPFAKDEFKQAAYLIGFSSGWEYAMSGVILFGTRGYIHDFPGELVPAWNEGWKLGTKVGGEKLRAQLQKEQ